MIRRPAFACEYWQCEGSRHGNHAFMTVSAKLLRYNVCLLCGCSLSLLTLPVNSVNDGCAKEWVFAGALNYSVDGFMLMFAVLICLSCELGVSVCVFSLYFHLKCFFYYYAFIDQDYILYIYILIFFLVFNLQSWKTNLSFYQLCNNSECCSARIGHPHCTL